MFVIILKVKAYQRFANSLTKCFVISMQKSSVLLSCVDRTCCCSYACRFEFRNEYLCCIYTFDDALRA